MLKVIGGEQEGEFKAVASGTLPNGKPVVVNADGTVSVVGETSVSSSVGTDTNFNNSNTIQTSAAYDSTNNKVVLVYRDYLTTNYGMAIVGTVSGSSISFGTEVTFNTGTPNYTIARFDESTGKVVIVYGDGTNSNYGTAIVGTVSGTSISFGSKVVFNSAEAQSFGLCYESSAQKMVISYRDEGDTNNGNAIVGTVSGTSISFGSEATFDSDNIADTRLAYDANAGKVVVAYRNGTESNRGYAAVGTVSGTSITFGTRVLFNGGTGVTSNIDIVYDENAQKVVIAYKDGANSDAGAAIVGTVNGTSISFGSEAVFSTGAPEYISLVYHAAAKKVVINYEDTGNLQYGTAKACNISGTSLTFDSAIIFKDAEMNWTAATYDSTTEQVVVAYRDNDNSNNGYAVVYQIAYTSQNLTAENYIGMSRGVAFQTGSAASAGTPVVFESATTNNIGAAFDPDNNKVVIAYRDDGNSEYGTAIVGTVNNSDNSITFGTPTVFESARSDHNEVTYDTSNDKIVIAYGDNGNSNKGTAIVGTVSGTSISFGSPTIFETGAIDWPSITFDSTNNKVVVAYSTTSNSDGKAIVGTVSGTSISFGSSATFDTGSMQYIAATYDSNAQKVVIAYAENNGSTGDAIVGTVSGTSISFGSAATFESGAIGHVSIAYDTTNSKVVIIYKDNGNSSYGTAIVGTVSGTSISFGTAAVFNEADTTYTSIVYDSSVQKLVISYKDGGDSSKGKVLGGTVSGTDITFDTAITFEDGITNYIASAYDSNAQRTVIAYGDDSNSTHGTAAVYEANSIATTRGEVADGDPARIDIIGAESTIQIGLTAGEKYYVQTDGTLSTTAGSPSVLAGTAISATKLVVKT